jgi:DNA-binding MarR family transcriptional regulator
LVTPSKGPSAVDQARFDAAIDAMLLASRAMVGIAARSLPEDADVTLVQFRALVLLNRDGALNAGRLAELLAVSPSTVTGLCDRLIAKGLVAREPRATNRREVVVTLAPAGKQLVDDAVATRRKEIARILAKVAPTDLEAMVEALRAFTEAAEDSPAQVWSSGWTSQSG